MRNEIPEIGTRPNSQAQKLWDRHVAHGKAGAAAKARKKAQRIEGGNSVATTRNPPNDEEGKDPTK